MRYTDIPKRTVNAVEARLRATHRKYGWDATRIVSSRYFNKILREKKLQDIIASKEAELKELKRGK